MIVTMFASMSGGALLGIGLKGLAGGVLVVVFAAIGEIVRPRDLAGILSGAPSIALAGLGVAVVSSGVAVAEGLAVGMIAGGVAFVAWCLVGIEAVKRLGSLKGSVAATAVWFVTAFSLWAVVLR
jgi:hypothetical protein